MYFSCTNKKSTKRSSRHELRSHENITVQPNDKQTRGINTPQTVLVFTDVSQIFSAHSITVGFILQMTLGIVNGERFLASLKGQACLPHPFCSATAGCSKHWLFFSSFGCVFFSFVCKKEKKMHIQKQKFEYKEIPIINIM